MQLPRVCTLESRASGTNSQLQGVRVRFMIQLTVHFKSTLFHTNHFQVHFRNKDSVIYVRHFKSDLANFTQVFHMLLSPPTDWDSNGFCNIYTGFLFLIYTESSATSQNSNYCSNFATFCLSHIHFSSEAVNTTHRPTDNSALFGA